MICFLPFFFLVFLLSSEIYCFWIITRWTLSDLDPADFWRPSDLEPSFDFGTTAEKRVSSSDTSNSEVLHEAGRSLKKWKIIENNGCRLQVIKSKLNNSTHSEMLWALAASLIGSVTNVLKNMKQVDSKQRSQHTVAGMVLWNQRKLLKFIIVYFCKKAKLLETLSSL